MKQISDLFQAALDCAPAERAAFLAQACAGDAELQREVELLLAADEQAASFLEEAPFEAAAVLADEQAEPMPGRQIGPYRIEQELGHGGMGVVYLALDTRLDRQIAIKLLPAEFTQDAGRVRRFIQEAKAASALNHPNIITIYEIGEVSGTHYIATELIDGQTLRQQMKLSGMDLPAALDVAIQVASALTEAHAAGIIHRDIKPENVMLRRDRLVKVLDFGLAKLAEREGAEVHRQATTATGTGTAPGTVMGTVSYMSPEQARGLMADARSDIFSLGIVLYEMIAGRRPFDGATAIDVAVAILEREPPPLSQQRPEVPGELQRIVSKALRKDREERYQHAQDLLLDLKSLKQELEFAAKLRGGPALKAGGSEPASATTEQEVEAATNEVSAPRTTSSAEYLLGEVKRHKLGVVLTLVMLLAAAAAAVHFSPFGGSGQAIDSLAVLPFVNVGANPDTEYLSDGITDSLTNSLSQLPRLKVMSRNSVFRYKGHEADAQAAGKQLGVQGVLTGRIVPRGDGLSISTELVYVPDNRQLWGAQYNPKLSDLLAMQAELARDISEKLRLRLSSEDQQRLTKRGTENAEAYELYLKGRYILSTLTAGESSKKGMEYFQRALEKDPRYGSAYAGLAGYYASAAYVSTTSSLAPKEAYAKAKAAALRAVELDDSLAEAHTALGEIAMLQEWDWQVAERELKRAIALNPNYVRAHHWYSHYFIYQGRFAESLAESQRALALDPLDVGMNFHLGFHYYNARQYEQASAQLQKTLEINRNHEDAHVVLGLVNAQQGRYQEALTELQKSKELGGPDHRGNIGYLYAVSGQRGEAQKLLAQLQEEAKHKYVSPERIARIYAGLGEKDEAFAWLEKAYAERDSNLTNLKVDPQFDSLRPDPRFTDLLRRIGLTQ